jgi:hypothetical protein
LRCPQNQAGLGSNEINEKKTIMAKTARGPQFSLISFFFGLVFSFFFFLVFFFFFFFFFLPSHDPAIPPEGWEDHCAPDERRRRSRIAADAGTARYHSAPEVPWPPQVFSIPFFILYRTRLAAHALTLQGPPLEKKKKTNQPASHIPRYLTYSPLHSATLRALSAAMAGLRLCRSFHEVAVPRHPAPLA